ncbi:MAG: amidase [Alphaproteobacteria bacterium]|nr:MAG: amidase [Alphaproteobacteria bacterium]
MAAEGLIGASALALRERIAAGALSAAELAEAFLARIDAAEPEIRAFAHIDPDHVRAQARALDEWRRRGRPIGPLHGLPVAVKDIIDTARMPTENGTPLDAGRVPAQDAFVVARLRAAGAVILGKTVTTELAFLHPGPTRNPNAPGRTPGGSSSGSAAAVAAGMAPLALGTQTGGSVIRPASFCGVVGFKPTFGAIPRTGVLTQSPSLDTVGVFARGVGDAALIAEALFGHDPADPATQPAPAPRLLDTASAPPPVTPLLAFVPPPGWDQAAPEMRAAFEELVAFLGQQCETVRLPPAFDEAAALRERINFAEMAKCFHHYERRGADRLSHELRAALEAGKRIPARDYIAALDWPRVLNAGLEEIFHRFDAILTPAAPGPAPEGLDSTGSSIFNGLWTLCGVPCITLPLLETAEGLPMGVQLVARRWDDARLLRTANWLVRHAAGGETQDG